MTRNHSYRTLALVTAALATSAMAGRVEAQEVPDSARRPSVNPADVRFMTSMIGHHAQAIVMARMAPTHGASDALQRLTARVVNAQQDEIAIMQQWLRERGQHVPQVDSTGTVTHGTAAGGHQHGQHHQHHQQMPGMLTEAQMKQLDAAQGKEFDRLFLTFMIQHHQGAVAMVKELFGSQGAALDDTVFKIASDINVDQTTEIARMQKMLFELLIDKGSQ
jgi:uncharacterized protein (DUF305 family)